MSALSLIDFYPLKGLSSGSALYRAEPDENERTKYRTECWLEGCLARERLCAPDEHITFVPLNIQPPIPGADKIVISPSGLDVAEDMWIKRLTRALSKILFIPGSDRVKRRLLRYPALAKFQSRNNSLTLSIG